MTENRWRVPRAWPGQTVALLGGGSSLTQDQVDACRGRCRVIAINDAYRLAPWADVLYFCDRRWWLWHEKDPALQAFAGEIVSLECYDLGGDRIKHVHNFGSDGLYLEPDGVMTGRNSGIQAINLAVHFGASRIVLLGYDMKPGHWHAGHPAPTRDGVYADSMIPMFPAVRDALDALGVECVNCTPGSALEVFRRGELADVLSDDPGSLRGRAASGL